MKKVDRNSRLNGLLNVLDVEKIKEGRKDEMDFMDKIEMFDYIPESVCWQRTGAAPVSSKWVEAEKVDEKCR